MRGYRIMISRTEAPVEDIPPAMKPRKGLSLSEADRSGSNALAISSAHPRLDLSSSSIMKPVSVLCHVFFSLWYQKPPLGYSTSQGRDSRSDLFTSLCRFKADESWARTEGTYFGAVQLIPIAIGGGICLSPSHSFSSKSASTMSSACNF